MTMGGAIYLAIILAAFLTYAAALFWAMITSSRVPRPLAVKERHPADD